MLDAEGFEPRNRTNAGRLERALASVAVLEAEVLGVVPWLQAEMWQTVVTNVGTTHLIGALLRGGHLDSFPALVPVFVDSLAVIEASYDLTLATVRAGDAGASVEA